MTWDEKELSYRLGRALSLPDVTITLRRLAADDLIAVEAGLLTESGMHPLVLDLLRKAEQAANGMLTAEERTDE